MARGLALGWRQPVLCTDIDAARAQALADEVGGEAVATNAELAQRADLVVLCHKPAQLESVAREVAPHARAIVSILAATPLADVKAAYSDRPVYRVLPSTPVEFPLSRVTFTAQDGRQARHRNSGIVAGNAFDQARDLKALGLGLPAQIGLAVTVAALGTQGEIAVVRLLGGECPQPDT